MKLTEDLTRERSYMRENKVYPFFKRDIVLNNIYYIYREREKIYSIYTILSYLNIFVNSI